MSLSLFLPFAGVWRGTNRLHDPHTNAPDDSASELTVTLVLGGTFARIDYSWAYQGQPQSGMMLVGQERKTGAQSLVWIDSWHMADKMLLCQGSMEDDRVIIVRGTYAAPPGPDWGWRIRIEMDGADSLRVVMHNIWPEGKEDVAVEANYQRES